MFCSIGGWYYSRWWVWDLRTLWGKWNEDTGLVQDFIYWFCVWCKSRELRGIVSPTFPCVIMLMESFSSARWATISYWIKWHLKSCQTSTMELFSKNSQRPKNVDYFCKMLYRGCSTWFQIHLRLERCCKYGVSVDCKCMEFIAAGWCTGKYLKLDQTIREIFC